MFKLVINCQILNLPQRSFLQTAGDTYLKAWTVFSLYFKIRLLIKNWSVAIYAYEIAL